MAIKNGFFLIESMISLMLALFFIFIMTHYIIEIKKIQQEVIVRAELLSCVRNSIEKSIASSSEKEVLLGNNTYDISFSQKKISLKGFQVACPKAAKRFLKEVVVEKRGQQGKKSVGLCIYE